jgi:glycosyltransferase involved in cell wall biosynthesis
VKHDQRFEGNQEATVSESASDVTVGIYVASFNTCEFTRRCIQSIIAHTEEPYLLTVGDSASRDGSREMLQGYADAGALEVQVEQKARGHAWWLDKWLQECSHPYAVFLDSDVQIRRDGWLSRMLEGADDASIVCADFVKEGRGVVEPVKGRTVRTAERPGVHIMLIRPADLRTFSFSPFHIEAPWVEEGAIVYDVGAALWHGVATLGVKWRLMPWWFGLWYRHYGGASWLDRPRGLRDHLRQII